MLKIQKWFILSRFLRRAGTEWWTLAALASRRVKNFKGQLVNQLIQRSLKLKARWYDGRKIGTVEFEELNRTVLKMQSIALNLFTLGWRLNGCKWERVKMIGTLNWVHYGEGVSPFSLLFQKIHFWMSCFRTNKICVHCIQKKSNFQ